MNEIPIGFGDVERVEPGEARGVVDQTIERAKRVVDVGEEADDLRDFGEIGLKQGRAAAGFRNFFSIGA